MAKIQISNFIRVVDAIYSLLKLMASVAGDLIDDGKINGSNKSNDNEE